MESYAGVLYGVGDLRVEPCPVPQPGDNDILVRVTACGICGTDLHMYHTNAAGLPTGTVLGHEFSGVVVKVGGSVAGIRPGMRVTANPMVNLIGLGATPGAFSTYLLIERAVLGQHVFVLPDSVGDEAGALIEPFAVGLHAVQVLSPLPGARVVIYGAGTIGLCVLAALRLAGVSDVVVIDVSPLRLQVAEQLGARAVIDARATSVRERLIDLHGEARGLPGTPSSAASDAVIDCAGLPQTLHDAIALVRPGGTVLTVATYPPQVTLDVNQFVQKQLRVLGSLAYGDAFGQAVSLCAEGRVDLQVLVSHRFALADLAAAFACQSQPSVSVKVLVRP